MKLRPRFCEKVVAEEPPSKSRDVKANLTTLRKGLSLPDLSETLQDSSQNPRDHPPTDPTATGPSCFRTPGACASQMRGIDPRWSDGCVARKAIFHFRALWALYKPYALGAKKRMVFFAPGGNLQPKPQISQAQNASLRLCGLDLRRRQSHLHLPRGEFTLPMHRPAFAVGAVCPNRRTQSHHLDGRLA